MEPIPIGEQEKPHTTFIYGCGVSDIVFLDNEK